MDVFNVLLLLGLIGCLLYIFWMHNKFKLPTSLTKAKKEPKKVAEPVADANDEISFLNSNYDMSLATKETDSLFADNKSTASSFNFGE